MSQPQKPWWVQVGLWGVPNRASAWVFVWICMAAALACLTYAFVDRNFLWGGLFVVASVWYLAAISWMDRHRQW